MSQLEAMNLIDTQPPQSQEAVVERLLAVYNDLPGQLQISAQLGWTPHVPLNEGLAKTVEYFKLQLAAVND